MLRFGFLPLAYYQLPSVTRFPREKTLWIIDLHCRYTSMKVPTDGVLVYAFVLEWPKNDMLTLMAAQPTSQTIVSMLGYSELLKWAEQGPGMNIDMPLLQEGQKPCEWAWVLKLTHLT